MLLALFAVLIPLAVGVYALYAAVTGGFDLDETVSLVPRQRLMQLLIALVAFGLAGYAYSRMDHVEAANTGSAAAEAAHPPEHPGEAAINAVADAASASIKPATGANTPATQPASAPEARAEPSPAPPATSGLSQSAAALETEWRQPASPAPATVTAVTAAVNPSPSAAPPTVRPASPARDASPRVVAADAEPAVAMAPARASPSSRATSPGSWPQAARQRGTRLIIHLTNRLGAQASREQLALVIEGLEVAQLVVDTNQPTSTLAVPLPRTGRVHYRLSGRADGDQTQTLDGEGCIRVRDGARFAVRQQPNSNRVFLEPVRG